MNKHTFLMGLMMLFITNHLFAQTGYQYANYQDGYILFPKKYLYNDKHIKTIHQEVYNKKGLKSTNQTSYNEHGYCTNVTAFDKKGQQEISSNWSYDDQNRITKFTRNNKKGVITLSTEYIWNEKGDIVEKISKNKKGKIWNRKTWSYNDADQITEIAFYKKNGTELSKKWIYIYDADGKKLQTQVVNAKGKVLHVWTYDCHEEGAKLEKEKNKTQVCQWSVDKGKYLIKTYQSFDEKGKIRRNVYTYTLKDTIQVEQKTFDENDSLIRHSTYNKQGNISSYSYYRKGKLRSMWQYEYVDGKVTKARRFRSEELKKETNYTYNDKGILASRETIDDKGKRLYAKQFSYTFYPINQ